MAIDRTAGFFDHLDELRYQSTEKRVRVLVGGTTVADTRSALLIWEPRRVVASYAIPTVDISGEIVTIEATAAHERPVQLGAGPPMLDPSTPFAFHTAAGTPVEVVSGAARGVGYRLADPDLDGYVVLDFDAFDWLEEDEAIFGHPRDPFSRIDMRSSSRRISIELGGVVLAESSRPVLLFETMIPARYYLPADDVQVALTRSDTRTVCAYKGHATHWSVDVAGEDGTDIAWSYEKPPLELSQVSGLVCFYQERVDVTLDGFAQLRPVTPWS